MYETPSELIMSCNSQLLFHTSTWTFAFSYSSSVSVNIYANANGPKPSSSSACVGCMSEDTHGNRVCSNRASEPKTATGYFTLSASKRKELINVGSPSSVQSVPTLKN